MLHRRPDYRFPTPSRAESDRASRGELGLVLMTTRRLLAAAVIDARALHKHVVLLCKILLRADGLDLTDPDVVLATFAERHRPWRVPPPTVADLGQGPADARLIEALTYTADHLLDHLDTLPTSGRPPA